MPILKDATQQSLLVELPTHSKNLKYNPSFDHIRFLVFFLVFSFHVFSNYFSFGTAGKISLYTGIMTEGYTGVTLFFVLSGFLFMSIALASDHISYKGFLLNRLLRIYPLFLFIFFIAISISRDKFVASDLLYILSTNLGQPPTSLAIVTGAAWTISIEFTFYLVFPFLANFAKQRGPIYLVQAILLMFVIRLVTYAVSEQPTEIYYWTLIGRFDQFLIGMLTAQVCSRLSLTPRLSRLVLFVGAAAIVTLVWHQGRYAGLLRPQPRQPFWITWGVIEAACWAAFIVGYSNARIAWPTQVAKWLQRGGELSYSLYLTHMMAITLLLHYVGPLATGHGNPVLFLTNGALALTLTWMISALTFRVIEQPFLNMRRRYVSGEQSQGPNVLNNEIRTRQSA